MKFAFVNRTKKYVLLISYVFLTHLLNAQTVGTLLNTETSVHNFTLIAPSNSKATYLIDNCGYILNEWLSDYRPGAAAYLDEEGNLYRTGRTQSNFFYGGGIGGLVEKYNFKGDLLWTLNLANDTLHQHHDIEILPNGNILTINWEYVTKEKAIASGRLPSRVGPTGVWPTVIYEFKHIENDEFELVWEWHAWDHIIQNVNSNIPNYGLVANHPERIDANLTLDVQHQPSDWLHANGIDYNAELDNIVISLRSISEFFILDHSTTPSEAASSVGGNFGKGGDLLYRFGNYKNVDSLSGSKRILFGQHDVNWIETDKVGEGNLILYNNGVDRTPLYSEVIELETDLEVDGYNMEGAVDSEDNIVWTYNESNDKNIFSTSISGARRLEKGNTLITEGNEGNIIEVNNHGTILWRYIVPVNALGPMMQGQDPMGNNIFKAISYEKEFFNFHIEKSENAIKIELNDDISCTDYSEVLATGNSLISDISLAINSNTIIVNDLQTSMMYQIYSTSGQHIKSGVVDLISPTIEIDQLTIGLYYVKIYGLNSFKVIPFFRIG